MKLRMKLSLLCLIIITAAVGACSLMMLISAGKNHLNAVIDTTVANQKVRAAAWSAAMQSELKGADSSTARRSLARYLIRRMADDDTILLCGDDVIHNRTSIDPREYLPPSGMGRQYIIVDIAGEAKLLVGSAEQVGGMEYLVYLVHDVTAVYTGMEALARSFALMELGVIAAAGALLVLLMRRALRPLSALKESTSLIAGGVYDHPIAGAGEDEVGELAEDFNRMAGAVQEKVAQLQEEAQRRTWFMLALTHELKTPMTAIKGNAQTLLATKLGEEEREDALLCIDRECTRIERLSQKLMELIVLRKSSGLKIEPTPVAELLEAVRAAAGEQLRQRGLTLRVENRMDTLPMEKSLLASLLLNLIDNAGKASPPGGCIELRAEGGTISVADHGMGMEQEELGKITEPFYMVDKSRSRKAGGMGLGLALAGEIAGLHGARLEFESAPGEGTTAKVVFGHEA